MFSETAELLPFVSCIVRIYIKPSPGWPLFIKKRCECAQVCTSVFQAMRTPIVVITYLNYDHIFFHFYTAINQTPFILTILSWTQNNLLLTDFIKELQDHVQFNNGAAFLRKQILVAEFVGMTQRSPKNKFCFQSYNIN
jgi:hypothetical protein